MSHTPGPWKIIRIDREMTGSIYTKRTRICTGILDDMKLQKEAEANAHLIAAAPELLEALETMERLAGTPMMEDDPARVAAQKALRKARGEE